MKRRQKAKMRETVEEACGWLERLGLSATRGREMKSVNEKEEEKNRRKSPKWKVWC